MEVTIVDPSDHVGWLASATRVGEIYMYDVRSMVANIRAHVGNSRMRRLNILDHGNSMGFQLGSDWLNLGSLPTFEPLLRELRGCFTYDGFAHLQSCYTGRNHDLLRRLSAIWDVPVVAGTGRHNPLFRINFGQYDRCIPSGACTEDVRRP